MGAFEYTAIDTVGREQKGVIEGDTPKQVRQLLRERQLLPVSIGEVAQKEAKRQRSFGASRGLSSSDLALLTRQLATLSRAGLPLEEALLAVSQQSEKPRVQSIMLGVRGKVMEGHTLADGFADFPRVFPEIYRSTVSAGEQSGRLDNILERLADYTENREVMRQKILGAMLYPIVLSVICFGIVTGMMVYVVPKVIDVFEQTKGKLPLSTQLLISVSGFLREYGLWLLIAVVLAIVGFFYWLKNPDSRRVFHRFLLRVPLVGRLVRGFNTARFTRTFSILTASAVPVLEAMRISGEVVTNIPMRDAVIAAAARVREGAPIGRSLAQSKLFPPMTVHLISSGESSGELDTMLERAATNQERELDSLLGALVGLLGPLLIIVMGCFVMGIVFAMLMPIFEMNNLIR
jgi:general secretion pathway protein F